MYASKIYVEIPHYLLSLDLVFYAYMINIIVAVAMKLRESLFSARHQCKIFDPFNI